MALTLTAEDWIASRMEALSQNKRISLGASCENCHKELSPTGQPGVRQCKCPEQRITPTEIILAHGLEAYTDIFQLQDSTPGKVG